MLSIDTRQQYATLRDSAILRGDSDTAIIYLEIDRDPVTISSQHFRSRAINFANTLRIHNIQSDDIVIIAHNNVLESIFAFWGALILGAIPSMFPTLTEKLDPQIYRQNMAELIRFSDVKAIVTADNFAPFLAELVNCPIITTPDKRTNIAQSNIPTKPDSIALLQHSSGTTGLQKGVALSHKSILNQLASYSDALQVSSDDVVVSWLPLYHDMGLIAGFLLPLLQGIPLVLMSPFDWIAHPAMLLRAIDDYKGTLCWLPNFAYNHMARRTRKRDTENLDLSSMRAFINCSEPVHHDSHQKFLERFADCGVTEAQLTVSYAMAENTFAVTQTKIGQYPKIDLVDPTQLQENGLAQPSDTGLPIVSCGRPIQNVHAQVLDDSGDPLPERYIGDIVVKSDSMLTNYHNRPDLQPFVDGWYQTGDKGYIADGEVYIIGRKKDLIISAGKNVYPQDIEAIVNTVDGVHKGRCVVFGVPDDREGTELVAVVAEIDDRRSVDEKALKKAIRQQIATQSTVSASFVTLVDARWLIKTSSGKIARSANRDKWLREFK